MHKIIFQLFSSVTQKTKRPNASGVGSRTPKAKESFARKIDHGRASNSALSCILLFSPNEKISGERSESAGLPLL
jgi:hypothetical protein